MVTVRLRALRYGVT